jgi:AraC-like DNA-binding protein
MQIVSPPSSWREGVIHAAYVRIAISLAQRLGIQVDIRLSESGRMATVMDVLPLLERLDVAANPYLGIDLGSLIPASAHGAMGYAVVSSPTVGDAMHTLARYASMRNRFFQYTCNTDENETRLVIKPRMPLGELSTFCEIGTAVSLFKTIQGVAGDEAAAEMRFDANWASVVPINVPMRMHYGQEQTALIVPLTVANTATPTADAKLYASACRSCEEELAAIGGDLASRLRSDMPNDKQEWPSLKDSAQRLAMSPRTLIRRLAVEGLTYQSLLDDAKSELACWYLKNTVLPMGEIAERLSFADDTNFSRSFRRWRNCTPLQYRKMNK